MKNLIFDFDGTIADTLENAIRIVAEMADEYQFLAPSLENIEKYRAMTSKQLARELHFPVKKLHKVLPVFHKRVQESVTQCDVFDGLKDVLTELQNNKRLFVLTSNTIENVVPFLEKHNLHHFFTDVVSEKSIWGKHRPIRKLLLTHNLPLAESMYIGDETRDIQACKKAPIAITAVTWGFNNRDLLSKYSPDFLIDSPRELLSITNIV